MVSMGSDQVSPDFQKKFEKIFSKQKKNACDGFSPKKMIRSSTKPILSKYNGQGSTGSGADKRKALENTYKKLTKRLEKFSNNSHLNSRKNNKKSHMREKKKNKSLVF